MATQQHLQIINPVHRESRSFPSFSRLPAELRLDIWQLSLRRSRLISIELAPDEGWPSYETRNSLGRVISGTHYRATVHGSQLLSKLLRVSSEARQAALGFYRVHLPCRFELGSRQGRGTMFLNPEFDTLYVRPGGGIHSFPDFLHDLRAHDPLGASLLNLAVDHDVVANLAGIDVATTAAIAAAAFADTLARLRRVYFVCLENAGRIYLGPRGGIHTVAGFEFHRSRPIMATTPTFDRVGRDPRGGMARDLSRVFVGTFDPRQMVYRWRLLLDSWREIARRPHSHPHSDGDGRSGDGGSGSGSGSGGPEYRFLVAKGWGIGGMAKGISDRAGAAEWLREEDQRWTNGQKRHANAILRKGGKLPVESPEELERVPRPAIGFWLFPVEALGPMPGPEAILDEYDNGSSWESKRVVDMRQHWPELCLASMP